MRYPNLREPTCPSETEWLEFLSGSRDDLAPRIEQHLESCPACEAKLRGDESSVPRLLKQAALETSRVEESLCARLQSALRVGATDLLDEVSRSASVVRPVPARVGDYELGERIGSGGMGDVYRATQVSLRRSVAVKMLSSRRTPSSNDTQRLIAEAQRLARVSHSNIVQAIDVGEHDGVTFFSMELIDGKTLAEVNRLNLIPLNRKVEILIAVAEAIHAAHLVDVIHRDLKPANILLTQAQEVKVTDFGLAMTCDEAVFSDQREVAGTAEYMAPEQWAGKPELLGRHTDVYGLGAVMYELLTSNPPFPSEKDYRVTRRRALSEMPVRPRQRNRNVPRDLEAICMRCLEKTKDRRYASAREVADELRLFQRGRPLALARPAGFLRREAYRFRRNGGLVCTALFVLLCTSGLAWKHISTLQQEGRTREARSHYEKGVDHAKEGRTRQARSEWRQALEQLPPNEADLRRHFGRAIALWEAGWPTEIVSVEHPHQITAASVSTDGAWLIFGDSQGEVRLRSVSDGKTRVLRPADGRAVLTASFNPSGKRCCAGGMDCRLTVWDVERGEELFRIPHHGQSISGAALLGEGNFVATGCSDKEQPLRLWRWSGHLTVAVLSDVPTIHGSLNTIVGAPDGSAFVACSMTGNCLVVDSSGKLIHDLREELGKPVSSVAFSNDSKVIAGGDSEVMFFSLKQGQATRRTHAPPLLSVVRNGLAFHPNGGLGMVLSDGSKAIVRQLTADLDAWDDIPLESSKPSIIAQGNGAPLILNGIGSNTLKIDRLPMLNRVTARLLPEVEIERASRGQLACSADGERIVTLLRWLEIDKKNPNRFPSRRFRIEIWDSKKLASLTERTELGEAYPWSIDHSPTDKLIAIGCQPNNGKSPVLIGDYTTGTLTFNLIGEHIQDVMAVAFSRDGESLFSASARVSNGMAELAKWSVKGTQLPRRIDYPSGILALAVSPDGGALAVGDGDGVVRFYTTDDLTFRGTGFESRLNGPVTSLAFSKNGQLLACGTTTGQISVLRLEPDRLSRLEFLTTSDPISGTAFDHSTDLLLTSSWKPLRTSPDHHQGIVSTWDSKHAKMIGREIPFLNGVMHTLKIPNQHSIAVISSDVRLSVIALPTLKE